MASTTDRTTLAKDLAQGSLRHAVEGDRDAGAPGALEPIHSRYYSEVPKMFDEAIDTAKESAPQDARSSPSQSASLPLSEVQTNFKLESMPALALIDAEMAPRLTLTTSDSAEILPAPLATTQPRRSARIRDLHGAKDETRTHPSVRVSPTDKLSRPALPSTAPQPNRSERIGKRKLKDDGQAEAVSLAPKRAKKGR
ncbi:hypothetical protein FA13DRAFT_1796571 [Coprinellus micaceus]|uniref:Uncharacterized protein n=1 Tax=Coprinellus micaceus TaxID=71717 RepID=A0A4Y7SVP5_COPMI|nr:hypothetical protein FA13DRAFT_1796571 [Coprinellus micaceus]